MSSREDRVISASTGVVDVIVPVYRGFEETRRCIESVLKAHCATAFELVLIDDASPEPGLVAYCDSLRNKPGVTLLVNARNLGFVESVNLGMRLHPDRDVVLLNSDTEVANDWLDRLRRCADSHADIGTVTPFSNNATICSYPDFCADNALPEIGLAELDAAFARANAGACLDLPTAVGFCMYIKRGCLERVGLFDAGRFGRGYGEENDFSLRAARTGWRNVLCANVFVFHAGGVSFQDERERLMADSSERLSSLHPEYEALVRKFVAEDPPAKYRLAVDIELARRLDVSPVSPDKERSATKSVQLHVVHDLGGGIARWCEDFCEADDQRINLVLKPYSQSHAMGEGLMLFADARDIEPLAFWHFSAPIPATADTHPEYRQALTAILRDYGVDAVLVSSLIGHSLDVLDTGLPTVLVQHDFYPFCPAIHAYFHGVCVSCDAKRLAECAAHNHDFNPPHRIFPVEDRLRVRERFIELVQRRNLVMIAPTRAARAHFRRLAPGLDDSRFVTIPHGHHPRLSPIPYAAGNANGKLRIVVLGMLSVSKGVRLLSAGLDPLLEFAEVYLVGAREMGELFIDKPGVEVVSEYSLPELPAILSAIRPDVGLLLSVVPETFSYTLSELFILGIPPVATRLGGFAERIRSGETGYLFEPDGEALLACLRAIHGDRQTLHDIRANLMSLKVRSASEMVADYHRLLPLHGGEKAPAWMHRESESDQPADVMVSQALALAARWKTIQSQQLTLDMRMARLGACNQQVLDLQVMLGGQEQTTRRVEQQLHEAMHALASRDHEIAAVYASTSWRISSPVRWVGRRLRQGKTLACCLFGLLSQPSAMPDRTRSIARAWRSEGRAGLKRALLQWLESGNAPVLTELAAPAEPNAVEPEVDWCQQVFLNYRASFSDNARQAIRARIQAMDSPPTISVLVPAYNTPEPMLRDMLDSVCAQLYPRWQLCIADDGSSEPHVRTVLESYAAHDSRIRLDFALENGGVSSATNRALAMAEGEFIVLLDHDDLLEEQALFRVAEAVLADDPDMFYSDEVLVGEDGRTVQHFIFRPMFSPEYLRSHPYIVHLIGFRTRLLRDLGGLDESLRISQDYDLILRASERAERIVHIPEMLYRWRIHGASAGHAMIRQVTETSSAILRRHLQRCGEAGTVGEGQSFNFYDVRYPLGPGLRVAILIPTKNHADLVRACIESIQRTAGDIDYEIVLVDHDSDDPVSLAYFDSLRSKVTLLRYSGPFNFAAINNWAVAQLDGSHTHYLFCNNDIEAIEPGWLGRMLELGQKPDVGIVGAKLYYPDRRTIQHAGVVVACCGVAENLARFRITSENPHDLGYIGSLICNREVSAVTAACMLIRGAVFKEIGGFDEAIAVGYGDVDLCLRAGGQGYRTLLCAHAVLLHHESFTRGRSHEDPHPEDTERFLAKWQALFETGDPYFNPNLSPHSPNWQVADPLAFKLDIRRRIFKR